MTRALCGEGLSAGDLEETLLWFTFHLNSASHPPTAMFAISTAPGRRKVKKRRKKRVWFEMQRDPECSPSVVYFHKNIPGVDSYSLVWKAESQCNFSRLRPGRGTPTVALIERMTLSFCTSTLERRRQRRKGHLVSSLSKLKKICTLTFHCPLQHVAPQKCHGRNRIRSSPSSVTPRKMIRALTQGSRAPN